MFAATKSFECILAFSLDFDGLEPLNPLVKKLQKRNQGICKTYQMIDNVISKLKGFRDIVDMEFEHWFKSKIKRSSKHSTISFKISQKLESI